MCSEVARMKRWLGPLVLAALSITACAQGTIGGDDEPTKNAGPTAESDAANRDSTPPDPTGDASPPTPDTDVVDPDTTPVQSDSGPSGTLHIERVYGNGTSLMGGWGAGVTLGVLVTDSAGKPAPGVSIAWSSRTGDFAYFPAASGSTSLTSTTDENGWSLPSINAPNPTVSVLESVMTAKLASGGTDSRDFFVQTTNNGDSLGPAGQQAFTGTDTPNHSSLGPYTVGATISSALTFTVVCSNATRCSGEALKNVSVRINLPDPAFPSGKSDSKLDPPVECVGIEPLSDAKGVVRCDLHIKRKFSGVIRAAVGQFVEFEYSLTAS
jgi:hypothetical protein